MIYFIKLIFIFLLSFSHYSLAYENKTNQILFKINNKVFTNIDLEKRKKYVAIINNIIPSKFSKTENKEILDDYISSLIFYEYFIKNKIVFRNLENEIKLIYNKNINDIILLNENEIKNFKFNTNIDLIRNKIIEVKLNSQKMFYYRMRISLI